MKKLFISIFIVCSYLIGFGQVSNYGYSKSVNTFTYNSSPTIIHSAGVDDALSSAINIGFTFRYESTNYTQFKASTNGFITFNTTNTLAQPTNNLKTSSERSILAPLWDDNRVGSSGNVNYKVTGTSPNRILTIEWKSLRWNKSGFSAGTIDTQIKLYETTNEIRFVYNRGSYQSFGNSIGIGASIGMSGSISGDFISVSDIGSSVIMSTTTETTTIGSSPTNLTTMTQNEANTQISNGLTFSFSEPAVSLPIGLSSFLVESYKDLNILKWSTETEQNNDFFTIEKTTDGYIFEDIGYVGGSGNSLTVVNYSFIDHNVGNNINYYRLIQTDFDGKSIYSDLISIDNRIEIKQIYRIVDTLGREVNEHYRGIVIIEYYDGTSIKIIR